MPGFMDLAAQGRLLRISAAALALVVLAFTLTVAASPSVRAAVLEVLRLKRVEVIRVDELPRVLDEPAEIEQLAGRTTMVGLETKAGFLVGTPTYPEGLGPPDEVYFQDLGSGRQVVLVYRARPGLSLQPVDAGDVFFTLFQFTAEGVFRKIIPSTMGAERSSLLEAETLWLEGASHTLQYLDPDGSIRTELERTVKGNTLVWEIGDVTYRLETSLPREEAFKIAESLR